MVSGGYVLWFFVVVLWEIPWNGWGSGLVCFT
jgi:hypothetical protein